MLAQAACPSPSAPGTAACTLGSLHGPAVAMTTALGWSCWQGMHLGGRGHLGLVCGGDPGKCMGDSCPGNTQAKQTWETPRVLAGLGQGLIFTAVSDSPCCKRRSRGAGPHPHPHCRQARGENQDPGLGQGDAHGGPGLVGTSSGAGDQDRGHRRGSGETGGAAATCVERQGRGPRGGGGGGTLGLRKGPGEQRTPAPSWTSSPLVCHSPGATSPAPAPSRPEVLDGS